VSPIIPRPTGAFPAELDRNLRFASALRGKSVVTTESLPTGYCMTPTPATPRPIPGRIGAVLTVLATIIAHARHFAATATTRASAPEFATAAAVVGTDHLRTILHRI